LDGLSKVSILVFLDQALKEKRLSRIFPMFSGFNPCFPGSSAERACSGVACPRPEEVSILVFLDQALKVAGLAVLATGAVVFQSLFSWIKR